VRCHIVLIACSGIQSFIFDTNKRRENVGASHLVASIGPWTVDALTDLLPGWTTAARITDAGASAAEVMTTAAGSAKVLTTSAPLARNLITAVTRRALAEAPGLDVCGTSVEFDWTIDGQAAEADRRVHHKLPQVRAGRPGPEFRFLRLPLIDECASSGLPASHLYAEPSRGARRADGSTDVVPLSRTSRRKLDAAGVGYGRLAALGAGIGDGPAPDPARAREGLEAVSDYLGWRADWIGVVHADGNGLGQTIKTFREGLAGDGNRAFMDGTRAFSEALDAAARHAYRAALRELREDRRVPRIRRSASAPPFLPVLPLVLGGDDLTVVCDGAAALGFTEAYLRAFEAETARRLAASSGGENIAASRITASAGVAIVKSHYPFSSAYSLAEDLMAEAKQVKTAVAEPASALSFHILHDSAISSLEEVRRRQTVDDGETRLVAQPYVVTGPSGGWAAHRHWSDLLRRVAALRASGSPPRETAADPGYQDGPAARLLPRSQTHGLRDALRAGRAATDAQVELLRRRYDARGLRDLIVGDSLFWEEPSPDPPAPDPEPADKPHARGDADSRVWVTGLLDAMDAEAFLSDRLPVQAGAGAAQ